MLEKVRIVHKMKIRMKRRKVSTRIVQMFVVTAVVTMFMYFIFQAGFTGNPAPVPDFAWLASRNMSHFIRPSQNTALATPAPCGDQDIELLVFVFSAPRNFEARRIVRKTWATRIQKSAKVRVVYILGQSRDPDIDNKVRGEAEVEKDVLLESFADTYLNLTLKTTFLLKWTLHHCPQAKFIFKSDDDVYVNSDALWAALESTHQYFKSVSYTDSTDGSEVTKGVDYSLLGHVMNTVPIRDPTSKWYLPLKFYPLNIFPKFLSGVGYVFTGSLVPALYHCAIKTPFINLEDVFLSGLCASTQLGLRLTHNPAFQWRPMEVGGSHTCNFKQSVLVHGTYTPEQLEEIFVRTQVQEKLLCDTLLFSFMSTLSAGIGFFRNIFRI